MISSRRGSGSFPTAAAARSPWRSRCSRHQKKRYVCATCCWPPHMKTQVVSAANVEGELCLLSLQLTEASLFITSRRSDGGRCFRVGGTFNPFNMTLMVRPDFSSASGTKEHQTSAILSCVWPAELHLLPGEPSELCGWGDIGETRSQQLDRETSLHRQQH